ncbi:MAG: hypothetical protein K8S98_16565 [Planctomycetes bacterium]|nr:hypothetical protein [Planctomycetota bacterium]
MGLPNAKDGERGDSVSFKIIGPPLAFVLNTGAWIAIAIGAWRSSAYLAAQETAQKETRLELEAIKAQLTAIQEGVATTSDMQHWVELLQARNREIDVPLFQPRRSY